MDKTTPLSFKGDSNDWDNMNWTSNIESECEEDDNDDPIISLDDDGLPCDNLHANQCTDIEQQEDSFAGDFYRCGTDWSCLNSSSSINNNANGSRGNDSKRKVLKQSSLFEMWKLPVKSNVGEFDESTSLVSSKKMKRNDVSKQPPQKQQQRACPFYKKMPGNYALLANLLFLSCGLRIMNLF